MGVPPMLPLQPQQDRASGLAAPTKGAQIAQPISRFGLLRDLVDKMNDGTKSGQS